MDFVYLKWYDFLYDVIYGWFIEPIWNLIKTAFLWLMDLFNEWILQPLIEKVLKPLWIEIVDTIAYYICKLIYWIMAELFHLIDAVEDMFNVFSGTGMVTYKGEDMPLLSAFLSFDPIKKVFWYINFMAFTLTFLFAVYAVVKSTLDFDFENRRPVSRVINSLIKSLLSLWTIQFFMYFMLELAGVILTGLHTAVQRAMGGAAESSMGRTLFVISSMNAAKETALNMSGSRALEVGPLDPIRKDFYQTTGGSSYTDMSAVDAKFNFAKFDFLLGYGMAIFVLIIMLICMVIFIQRIFDLILLYVVSPLFVSTIPLDDGEKFSKWRELFIGKCFTGYGMVLNMRLYLMVAPVVMGGSLRFSTSPETNFLAKALFLIGGVWAVYKSGTMITRIISQEAAMSERETAMMAMHAYGNTYRTVTGYGKQLLGGAKDAASDAAKKQANRAGNAFAGSIMKKLGYGQDSIQGVGGGRDGYGSGYGGSYGSGYGGREIGGYGEGNNVGLRKLLSLGVTAGMLSMRDRQRKKENERKKNGGLGMSRMTGAKKPGMNQSQKTSNAWTGNKKPVNIGGAEPAKKTSSKPALPKNEPVEIEMTTFFPLEEEKEKSAQYSEPSLGAGAGVEIEMTTFPSSDEKKESSLDKEPAAETKQQVQEDRTDTQFGKK